MVESRHAFSGSRFARTIPLELISDQENSEHNQRRSMRILQVHNHHQRRGGEEVMFEAISRILADRGHEVFSLERTNRDIQGLRGKLRAFREGIYSCSAEQEISSIIETRRPDVVHVHNVFTLISPSILVACRRLRVPVVIRCADFRFISCPVGSHLKDGSTCELCTGGREFWCVLANCKKNACESIAYALRTTVARKRRLFKDNITLYAPPSKFVGRRLIDAGFPEDRISVIPNMVSIPRIPEGQTDGGYIAYVGRISPEKGVDTLVAAAARTGLPVKIAGESSQMPELARETPPNVQFTGFLNRGRLSDLYGRARFSVVSSICFETFGLAAAEAMSHGLPVIASRIGALPEIVEDGVSGLLFDPGNAEQLAVKMRLLWENPELCKRMGKAARQKVVRHYSEDLYYKRLMQIYRRAIKLNKGY